MTQGVKSSCQPKPHFKDSPVIESMLKLGAVPFCQTNVPQALFTMQTSNPLYGATGNPLDKDRECGGSTGGEGSIVGAGKCSSYNCSLGFPTGNETVRWDLHTQIM